MTVPLRIQRKRTRGWNMPLNAQYAGRVGRGRAKYANPLKVGRLKGYTAADAVRDYERWLARDPVVRSYENVFGPPPTAAEIMRDLRGRNLACWCALCPKHQSGKPLDVICADCAPCHVDPLGRIANGFTCEAAA